jgi:hypothetical protein
LVCQIAIKVKIMFMKPLKIALITSVIAVTTCLAVAQDRSTGSIRGKVHVENGSPSGVTVSIREGERDLGQVETNRKGDFAFNNLRPGSYELTFRKPGLAVGKLSNVEVKAGKVNELSDRLRMTVDEGSVAYVRGSVFTPNGLSVPGAKVDVARIGADGSAKKLGSTVTTESGQFVFKLAPSLAKYRLTAKVDGVEPVSKEVQVDGAEIYRVALNLKPKQE